MNENLRRQLEENGVDVENTINRFMGNEALYMKFLGKFTDDQSYAGIGKYLEAEDYVEAYKCAHSLKGVTANLGLTPLQKAVSDLVEELRGKEKEEVNTEKTNEEWQNVQKEYNKIIEIINNNR